MRVAFLSMDEEKNKIYFETDCFKKDNQISFTDKSIPNTLINIELKENAVILNRTGETEMWMIFKENTKTSGFYKNQSGLSFDFEIVCHKLLRNDRKIMVYYDLVLDKVEVHSHKISLLFN